MTKPKSDDRFGSDLYEGERTLFIHDGRKCPQKLFVLFWLYIFLFGFFGAIGMVGLISEWDGNWDRQSVIATIGLCSFLLLGTPLGWCLAYVLLRAWWGLLGQQTLRIDGEQIRHDWWGPWGKGSKIWPRDRKITVTPGPGDEVISAGSIELQIGRKKVRFYLAKRAEVEWLCEKVERFLERTPATIPESDEKSPVKAIRGKLTDAGSGFALLQSFAETGRLEVNGETLRPVESGVETHQHQPPPSRAPIPVRCGRCHAFVPPERVLIDSSDSVGSAVVQCVECGTVFSIPELERGTPPKSKRITIDRRTDTQTGDTLRVRQGGDFSLYPMLTLLSVLFFAAVIWGLALYVRQLYPDGGLGMLFPQSDQQSVGEHWFRIGVISSMLGLFLLLPLWAFFERRTMTIDRERCRLEVRLLFFRWRRVIPRRDVHPAESNPVFLGGFRDLCRLRYGEGKSFCFVFPDVRGGRAKSGSFWLRGEINRFLYAFPAGDRSPSPDVYLGGMYCGYEILQPHCPHCNHAFAGGEAFDLSQSKNRCPACDRTFAAAEFVTMSGSQGTPAGIEGLECVETSERLEIRQHHAAQKSAYRGNVTALACLVVLFSAMLTPLFLLDGGVHIGTGLVLAAMVVGMLVFMSIVCIDEARGYLEWQWRLTVDTRQFELVLSFNNREKRIVVPLHEIRSAERNVTIDVKFFLRGMFRDKLPGVMQSSSTLGQHLLLHDGTRVYLPQIGGKRLPERQSHTEWFLSTLNAHLRQKTL